MPGEGGSIAMASDALRFAVLLLVELAENPIKLGLRPHRKNVFLLDTPIRDRIARWQLPQPKRLSPSCGR
jgi:hypothetical protein